MYGVGTFGKLLILQIHGSCGAPGTLVAAGLSIAFHGGAHGGGSLAELLTISTVVNFLLYAGLCIAARSLVKAFLKANRDSV
jgi:hypothetical protein